jgi:hypothetical protein
MAMVDWMLDVDTNDGVAFDEETVLRFQASLDAVLGETGTVASLDRASGSLGACFTVTAPNPETATEQGFALFRKALELTELAGAEPARATVERVPVDESIPA